MVEVRRVFKSSLWMTQICIWDCAEVYPYHTALRAPYRTTYTTDLHTIHTVQVTSAQIDSNLHFVSQGDLPGCLNLAASWLASCSLVSQDILPLQVV